MRPFFFEGPVPASKSVLIRWLVVASYGGPLVIDGDSACDDVRVAREGLAALSEGRPVDAGEGAFGFRALVARASRMPGTHVFRPSPRLAERPHGPLVQALAALGVTVTVDGPEWRVEGSGWQVPDHPIRVDGSFSSQFASALAVNGWDLPKPLVFRAPQPVSEGYFALTRRTLAEVDLVLEPMATDTWRIPGGRSVPARRVLAEPDMSSAFAVAALAAAGGRARLVGISAAVLEQSSQPDRRFPELLRRYGAGVALGPRSLDVTAAETPRPLDAHLGDAPDLFPVLAALVATAPGTSRLHGAPHLRAKESDRIAAVRELLATVGVRSEPLADGLVVHGRPAAELRGKAVRFDAGTDHRLVMAAAVLKARGLSIEIAGIPVVAKSFPEFARLL